MTKAEEARQQRQSFVSDVLVKSENTDAKIMVAVTLAPGGVYKIFKAGKLKPMQIKQILQTALELVDKTIAEQN